MVDTVDLPTSAMVGANEMPYWMLQAVPDRIGYTLRPPQPMPASIMKAVIGGSAGYNQKVQDYLEILGSPKLNAVKATGALYAAWLKFVSAFDASADPGKDATLKPLLDEFHRLACVKSSYEKLPVKVAKAVFWYDKAKVQLPRITYQEHVDMG
jgi:hypothetical protein